jgi:HEPN domain-containing protein
MTPLGREWVRKAEDDRRTVTQLRRGRPMVHDSICFHCQQCAEKYLKALIHERGGSVPKIHDCEDLLLILMPGDPPLAKLHSVAASLTQFAVQYRYPGKRADAKK